VKAARHLLRISLLTAVLAGGVVAEARGLSSRVLARVLEHTPAPVLVAAGSELAAADRHAASLEGAFALVGAGSSMEPLYAPNTAVVVAKRDYETLKTGMTVVYVSRRGSRVAHTIVGETRGGYILQGLNNDKVDQELLTPANYIGVVVDAFASSDSSFRMDNAARLAAKTKPILVAQG